MSLAEREKADRMVGMGWKWFRILDFLMILLYNIYISSSSRPRQNTTRKDALPVPGRI